MGFRINTNIGAMNAHRNSLMTNNELNKSLERLSSGLRINKAADDASGMAIADSLRSQAQGLGQAIRNANDGIGVVQTADGALDEYINIINTVRTKAIQAASDGQNADSRAAIQRDITRLLEEADNIAKTTSFNGLKLLDGSYTNKHFQIGAYSNETVDFSIESTRVSKTGNTTEAIGAAVSAGTTAADLSVNGVTISQVTVSDTTKDGANLIADAINAANAGVTATASTTVTGGAITAGSLAAGDLVINGVAVAAVSWNDNDSSGALVDAINAITSKTGVRAELSGTVLKLTSLNGENIHITDPNTAADFGNTGLTAGTNFGSVTLVGQSVSIQNATAVSGLNATTINSYTLEDVDVTTYAGAQKAISIADSALKELDRTRSDLGSVQNQLESTIRNISVTQVNVTAAESQIRDVDFAQESANFSKYNILSQSGSYALSQANAVQQNVLRLLQ
ncbi:MAG: flagellin B [Hydrogenimonas sp.]|nr:flagellin B [Hydrogenimonas sp.]